MPRPFEISHVISMGVLQNSHFIKNAPLDLDKTFFKNSTQQTSLHDGTPISGKNQVFMPRPFKISHVISMRVLQNSHFIKNALLDFDKTFFKNSTQKTG